MIDPVHVVRSWRRSGLTLSAIQERCEFHGYKTQAGTLPTIKTLYMWCKGIPKPPRCPKARRTRPYDPNTPPRRRLDQYPQNKGLAERIKELSDSGVSQRKITEQINAEGFTTTKGTPIGRTQVLRILKRAIDAERAA